MKEFIKRLIVIIASITWGILCFEMIPSIIFGVFCAVLGGFTISYIIGWLFDKFI